MILKNCLRQGYACLTLIAVAASLVACGGSDSDSDSSSSTPDPLDSYRAQTLQWAPCDDSILGKVSEKSEEVWAQLGDRLQCSTMRAPMDWSKPERSDVFVSVMRVASAAPAQRRGALFFNPGGPGEDGLAQSLTLLLAFGESNPASTQGALQLRLLDSYDMVGFSPRGTGASTRLQCATNELERFVDPSPSALTQANLANADYNSRKTAEACLRNPLTAYVNTDATARDMDLLRGLLGEEKLNYLGYSYGTWLGGWYASLFPDKVGRMVLDSSQDLTDTHEQSTLAIPPARQRLHESVMLPYAARHNSHFQLADSPAGINAMLQSLSQRMQGVLNESLGQLTYSANKAEMYVKTLSAARGLDAVLQALPDPSDEDALEAALEQQVFINDNSALNDAVREQAVELYKTYTALFLERESESIGLEKATYWAVSCNDTPATTDPQAWNAIVRNVAATAPLFFSDILVNPCVYWGGARVKKPDLAAMKALDVLMVQSQYDSATPIEGANRYFAQLPSARRVYIPGEFQHGVFPYSDTCVDTTVVRYLLGETPTARETSCQANPLDLDAVKPAPSAQAKQPAASQPTARSARAPAPATSAAQPTYLEPEKAQALIDRFKEGIGRRR